MTSAPSDPPSRLVCAGCGAAPAPSEPWPFRCPAAGTGDVDHVLAKRLAWRAIAPPSTWREVFLRDEPHPFLKYRELLHVYHDARRAGLADSAWTDLVLALDERVAAVDGTGFAATPFGAPARAADLGLPAGLRVKDETRNVAGSHKARHLFGVLLRIEAARWTGALPRSARPALAIASCGNAALAAAVLARAADLPLAVFVPVHADPHVLRRLAALGATIVPCGRTRGVPGDPCVHRFHDAVRGGALPFTCQGNENGLVIEGGETLAYEIVSALLARGERLDRIFVQVGGGALASACSQALLRAHEMGLLEILPRLHAVQARGGHPLVRAWERFRARYPDAGPGAPLEQALTEAARHRSRFMQPWDEEPKSRASGILDDETYDWLEIVRGMALGGGSPVVVEEETILRAHDLGARATGIPADPTGTSGLAGCVTLAERGELEPGARVGVLFTGRERG